MAFRSTTLSRFRLLLVFLIVAVTAGTLWSAFRKPTITWKGTNIKADINAVAAKFGPHRLPSSQRLHSESSSPEESDGDSSVIPVSKSYHQFDAIAKEMHFITSEALQRAAAIIRNVKVESNSSTHWDETSTSTDKLSQLKKPEKEANETCGKSCSWLREQGIRQRRVRVTCSAISRQPILPAVDYRLTQQTLRTMSHLLVLPSHKLIYCYVPKVSCTNWKRIFLVAKGIVSSASDLEQRATHIATDSHMRTLSSYPLETATRLLTDYRTFMFARHPFERVLSAYIDKFQLDYPASKLFREANAAKMAAYGDLARTPRLSDGTLNITFQQFARYVSDPKNQYLEPHWQEIYSQCQPCMIHYDYLGQYGTLKEDADAILEAANLNQTFPKSTNPTGSSERAKIQRYFSQLTAGEIDSLHRRFAVDFKLFGYTVPSFLLNVNATGG